MFLDFAADSLSRRSQTHPAAQQPSSPAAQQPSKLHPAGPETQRKAQPLPWTPVFSEPGPGALSSWRSPRTRSRLGVDGPPRASWAWAFFQRRACGGGCAKSSRRPEASRPARCDERKSLCLAVPLVLRGDLGRGRTAPHPGSPPGGTSSCAILEGRLLRCCRSTGGVAVAALSSGTWEADDGPL